MTKEEEVMAQILKDRVNLHLAIDRDVKALAQKVLKAAEFDLELYKKLHNPDCLFLDSPISSLHFYRNIRMYMIKCGMDFVGFSLEAKNEIPSLSQIAEDVKGWVMRFTKTPEPEKTGLEAIL